MRLSGLDDFFGRRPGWWSAVWLLLLLTAAQPDPARAQDPDSAAGAPVEARDTVPTSSREARLSRLPVVREAVLLGRSSVHVVSAPLRWGMDDARTMGLATGGVVVASLLDEAGRDLMARNQSRTADRLEEAVEPFGKERGLQLLGGLYLAGLVLEDRKLRAVAVEGAASALVAAGLIQPAIAEITGRPRPRRNLPAYTSRPFSGNHSFPSGHTIAAFATTSVIAAEYSHPAVQVAAYGLASGVGLARMYRGAHFFSDVVAAGMLGTVVGRSVARFARDYRDRLWVEPVVQGEETFLVLRVGVR